MSQPTDNAKNGAVKVGPITPEGKRSDTEAQALPERTLSLPPGLRPISLTEEEAETIRKKLDDPNEKTYQGKDLPKANSTLLQK